ncbi:MAG: FAD binding domain-containing protein [Nitrososphaerales archaeon]
MIEQIAYCEPGTLEEACSFLEEHGEKARIIAGGQSLIPLMKLNLVEIEYVVDLKRIPRLSFIRVEQGDRDMIDFRLSNSIDEAIKSGNIQALSIGALTTHSELEYSPVIKQLCPLLTDTVSGIGHPQIRNRGTIGGSLCHADPSADLIPTMLSLDAEMIAVNKYGSRRVIEACDYFTGPFSTSLQHSELLEKIRIPFANQATAGYSFKKFVLGHGSFPIVVVSLILGMEKGICIRCAVSIGGVADRAMRFEKVEDSLINTRVQKEEILNAASLAAQGANPEADLEVSSEYKRKIVAVLVKRALIEALGRVKA